MANAWAWRTRDHLSPANGGEGRLDIGQQQRLSRWQAFGPTRCCCYIAPIQRPLTPSHQKGPFHWALGTSHACRAALCRAGCRGTRLSHAMACTIQASAVSRNGRSRTRSLQATTIPLVAFPARQPQKRQREWGRSSPPPPETGAQTTRLRPLRFVSMSFSQASTPPKSCNPIASSQNQ